MKICSIVILWIVLGMSVGIIFNWAAAVVLMYTMGFAYQLGRLEKHGVPRWWIALMDPKRPGR